MQKTDNVTRQARRGFFSSDMWPWRTPVRFGLLYSWGRSQRSTDLVSAGSSTCNLWTEHGAVSSGKKVIDSGRRSTPGLLNVDPARETVGLLAWTVKARFPTLQDSPKENKLVQRCYCWCRPVRRRWDTRVARESSMMLFRFIQPTWNNSVWLPPPPRPNNP